MLLALIISLSALFSCAIFGGGKPSAGTPGGGGAGDTPGGGSGEGDDPSGEDSIIFDGDVRIVIPSNISNDLNTYISSISNALYAISGKTPILQNDSAEKYAHEIIVGSVDREASKKAYQRLTRNLEESADLMGYLVYSDGDSIAIAYTDEESLSLAVSELLKTYLSVNYKEESVPQGVLLNWQYDRKTYYNERDAVTMEGRWAALEKEINDKGYDGKETVKALRQLYALYTDDIYVWMANLYEPSIPCTCEGECPWGGDHGGGFYYSNSGRDTVGFLPDLESTVQVINFIGNTGMLSPDDLPKHVKDAIVTFVKSTQSSYDGYFYHPQWAGMETTDERRGRDQKWALQLLRSFGALPLYSTGGVEGTLGAPGGAAPASCLTMPLGMKAALAVGKLIPTATLEHLQSEAAFKEYLDRQDWTDAYVTGNRLSAQSTSIKDAGLLDFCIQYLNGKQKENGMWDDQLGERATNGFLKIAAIYQDAGYVIPRSKEAAEFCIELLLSEEPDGTVCWTYNVWYALDIIIGLLNTSEEPGDVALAEEIRDTLRKNAPKYIKVTAKKYATFIKRDNTFSFTPNATSAASQGMPVAVIGTNEGDVNASTISSAGVTGYMFSALGYEKVKFFTENDGDRFLEIINGLDPVIKTNTSLSGAEDFEKATIEDVFDETSNISNVVLGVGPDGFAELEADPRSAYALIKEDFSVDGNVLEFGKEESGLEARLSFTNKRGNNVRYVYEFDMKFMGGEVEGGSWHTRFSLYGSGMRFWYLLCYTLEDGRLALGSIKTPLAVLEKDTWYNIRFEYYTDTPDRACKVFVDGELVGEGGSTNLANGDSRLSSAFIEYRNEATDLLFNFDNVLLSTDDEAYTPPSIEIGDAIGSYYSDPMYKGDRYDYDADEPIMPTLLNNIGTLSVVKTTEGERTDARLQFSLKSASDKGAMIFSREISSAEMNYKDLCKVFELEFSYGDVQGDTPLSFLIGNREYELVLDPDSGNLNIKDEYNGEKLIPTSLAPDRVYVLRFECFAYADGGLYNITKVYVDEEYVGQLLSKYDSAVTKLGISMAESLAGSDAYVTVENVLVSNIDREYVKEVSEPEFTPSVEEIVPSTLGGGAFYKNDTVIGNRFDCEEIAEGMQTDGATSGTDDIVKIVNGVFVYRRNGLFGESYMRWNHESVYGLTSPVFVFETDFMFDGFKGNTPEQKIIFQANGISHQVTPSFTEVGGTQMMTLGKMTVSEGEWRNIRFELDYEAGEIYYFLDGEYCGSDYLSKTDTTYKRTLWYYMTKQTGGSMYFDNTFEGLVEDGTICALHTDADEDGKCDNCPLDMPKPEEPEVEIPENTVGGGAYYNGTEAGDRFNCDAANGSLKTDGLTSNDEAAYKNGQLVFTRNNDTGSGESYLRWNHSKPEGLTSPVFVFETDLYFTEFAVSSQTAQKIVVEANGIRHQITPVIALDGRSMTVGKLELACDTWYNIRFELDYEAGEIYYFLDGEYAGSEYISTGTTGNQRTLWYYMAKQTGGIMAFDNTFEGLVEDGTICALHTDADEDGKCDNCPLDMPKPEEPEMEIPENTVGGGAYYNGTEAGDRFNCDAASGSLKTDGLTSNDEAAYKNGQLVFTRNNDTGSGESYLRWDPTAGTGKIFVFETDIYFDDFAEAASTSLIRFLVKSDVDYQLSPMISNDGDTMTIGKLILSSKTWYNIRFEIALETGRINYFLNGAFAGSEIIASKSASYTGRVLWYYLGAQTSGTTVFDNTFTGYLDEGTAFVCEHIDGNSDDLCDRCGDPIADPEPPVVDPDPEEPDPENPGEGGGEGGEGGTNPPAVDPELPEPPAGGEDDDLFGAEDTRDDNAWTDVG